MLAAILCCGSLMTEAQDVISASDSSPPATDNLLESDLMNLESLKQGLQLKPPTAPAATVGNVVIDGPLPEVFAPAKPLEISKKLLNLVNPLAPVEPVVVLPKVRKVSHSAWSTQVGWTPGASAFPDERTHQPVLTFISLSSKTP